MEKGFKPQPNYMKWRVILQPDQETGEWAVWCPKLPGCTSVGDTEEEALENICEAIQLYLEALQTENCRVR
jgi:predicted RNase H-like HicB family nuclease